MKKKRLTIGIIAAAAVLAVLLTWLWLRPAEPYDDAVIREYSPIMATASQDIDGDGVREALTVVSGPTSGLYSIIIAARDQEGTIKYQNTFVLNKGEVSFDENDDTPHIYLDGRYHRLYVEDGCIVIDKLEEQFES